MKLVGDDEWTTIDWAKDVTTLGTLEIQAMGIDPDDGSLVSDIIEEIFEEIMRCTKGNGQRVYY